MDKKEEGVILSVSEELMRTKGRDTRIMIKQRELPQVSYERDEENKTITRTVSMKDLKAMLKAAPFNYTMRQINKTLRVMGTDDVRQIEVTGDEVKFFFRYKGHYCWLPLDTAIYLSDHIGAVSTDIYIYLLNKRRMDMGRKQDTYFSVSEVCRALGFSDRVREKASYPRKTVELGLATLRQLGFLDWGEPEYVKGRGLHGKQIPLKFITDRIPKAVRETAKTLDTYASEELRQLPKRRKAVANTLNAPPADQNEVLKNNMANVGSLGITYQ